MAGKEVVLLYSSDLYASLMPENKRLRAFEKIELQPGETKTVTLQVKASDLAFVGADNKWTLEEGDFNFICGKLVTPVKCTETYTWETPNIEDQCPVCGFNRGKGLMPFPFSVFLTDTCN